MNKSRNSEQLPTINELEKIETNDIIGVVIIHLIMLILSLTLIFWLIYKTDKEALLSQKIKHFFYFISQYFFLPFLFLYLLINISILGVSYLCCKNIHYITFKDVLNCSQKIFCCPIQKCKECLSNWFCSVCKCCKKERIQTIKVESRNPVNRNKEESINNKSNERMIQNNQDNLQLKFERSAITIKENEESKIIKNDNPINQQNNNNNNNEIKENPIEIINELPSIEQTSNDIKSNNNNIIRPPVKKPVNKSKIMEFLESALVNDNNNPVYINLINQVKDNIKSRKSNQMKVAKSNQANVLGKY